MPNPATFPKLSGPAAATPGAWWLRRGPNVLLKCADCGFVSSASHRDVEGGALSVPIKCRQPCTAEFQPDLADWA